MAGQIPMATPLLGGEWTDTHDRLAASYTGESDRAVALLAASFLEQQLGEVIRRALVDDAQAVSRLLEGYGPVSSLRARIDLLYGLGVVSDSMHKELHHIRRIRNHFAHHPDLTDFAAPQVADRCALLLAPIRAFPKMGTFTAREAYLAAISFAVYVIHFTARTRLQRPTIPGDMLSAVSKAVVRRVASSP
jgi:DNA-binding MltR family transcriptional regulator